MVFFITKEYESNIFDFVEECARLQRDAARKSAIKHRFLGCADEVRR
jgi:hypothetical protein